MRGAICRELEGGRSEVLRPVMEGSPFRPLRYLREVPRERLCDFWQAEVDSVLEAPSGTAFVSEVSGRLCGFCVLGDLPWESGILGKKMAAVKQLAVIKGHETTNALETLLEQAVQQARDRGYDFLLCKSYTDDSGVIHALEREGFLLVDTNLDFVTDLRSPTGSPQPAAALPEDVELRIAAEKDRDGLIEVSRRAFVGHFGRFHSDPRLGPERGRTIYERWIEACLDGWADSIVVAEVAGRIAGYSAWKRPSEREARHELSLGHYSIGAIHPEYYGRGLFSALTQEGVSLLDGLVTHIEGPTHVNNYPVHRGYLKLGWRIEDAHHSFHKWLTE